jgi:hypothetical protein
MRNIHNNIEKSLKNILGRAVKIGNNSQPRCVCFAASENLFTNLKCETL